MNLKQELLFYSDMDFKVLPMLLLRLWDSWWLFRSEEAGWWWFFWWCLCLTSSITSFPAPEWNTSYPDYFQQTDRNHVFPFKAGMNSQWGYWKSPADALQHIGTEWDGCSTATPKHDIISLFRSIQKLICQATMAALCGSLIGKVTLMDFWRNCVMVMVTEFVFMCNVRLTQMWTPDNL